jgi:hypothetical protein
VKRKRYIKNKEEEVIRSKDKVKKRIKELWD